MSVTESPGEPVSGPPLTRRLVERILGTVGQRRRERTRRRLARRFLHGSGLEIGALHQPLRLPTGARVRYVDRMDVAGLRRHYPELSGLPLVEADIIDDGETLATQPDGSADFVVANHFIEHTQDPIGTIASFMRVLRPGGILYLAVPDRRLTFDSDRPVTELEHLIRDHREGPDWSRKGHREEWARLVEKVPEEEVPATVKRLEREDYSIHFHVWEPPDFTELLRYASTECALPFTVAELQPNGIEFIAILRRT